MKDTSKKINDEFFKMLMQRSPAERLRMGCSMFDTAKQIVKSSVIQRNSKIDSREIKRQIFLRFYGQDLQKDQLKKIMLLI